MRDSPRTRRLRSDYQALEQLKAVSTILDFMPIGTPPESYLVRFYGRGAFRLEGGKVRIRDRHEVSIRLVASYPRMMPELSWQTPIFHPNISSNGVVCLGGYGTHWVPSLRLDQLCEMLWDMVRYENFDVESPYNREAAHWARLQCRTNLPLDPRPLRDKLAANPRRTASPHQDEVIYLGEEIGQMEVVQAEVVEPEGPDILFIE